MSKAKEIDGLDCEASAAEGIRLLLQTRVDEMCGLREGALDWSDIEGVHDMRVASRRLRSALRDFKPYVKRRKHRRSSDAIKRIADSLGAVRDKDVAIAALERLAASAPPDVAVGIKQFAAERDVRRGADRIALQHAIADDQLAILREEFAITREATSGNSHNGKSRLADGHLEVTFRAAGQTIVKARMEELQGFRASIYQPLRTKPLHKMRIAAKRLRYAIELFAQCWDTRLDAFAKEVAEIQTSLGELHDCDVWIAELGGLLEKHTARNAAIEYAEAVEVDKQRRHAYVWLLGHFTKRRTSYYRDALVRWHDWESTEFFTRLENCMQTLPANGGPAHVALSIANANAFDLMPSTDCTD